MTCFCLLTHREIFFFFLFICDTIYCAKWKCAHTWKRNVAEDMQVEYTAERKAMFPNVIIFLALSKHGRSIRFGVFMSAALSSSVACFPAGHRFPWRFVGSFELKSARSRQRKYPNMTLICQTEQQFLWRRSEVILYPHGPQVFKQLVSGRNTQQYWADTLTAQTPGWKKEEKPLTQGSLCLVDCLHWPNMRSLGLTDG